VSRLFVAVWPDPAVRSALAALPRPEEVGVRWVPPERWHVTVRFLGDADPEAASRALGTLAARPAIARFGPAVSRLGRTVLCVPVRGLDGLAADVAHVTEGIGEPPDPRPFVGHLTLARLHQRGSCRLAGHKVRAEMAVPQVALVASEVRPEGTTYRRVATFPLEG